MGVQDFTVFDYIDQNASVHADRTCMVYKDRRLSFREYRDRCNQVAAGLVKDGIQRGDRIAVIAYNSDEYMILYGAAAKIGAIVLAVNWRFQQDEMEYVLNDCTPSIVFAGADFQTSVAQAVTITPCIRKCYAIDCPTPQKGYCGFEELYVTDSIDSEPVVSADDGYVIIHTAAVEGHPRGALLSQANTVYTNALTLLQYNLGQEDCFISFLPLFHVAGMALSHTIMHAGGKLVVMERFDAEEALRLIEDEKGTIFFNFAPILGMLMDAYEKGRYDISSMRYVTGMDSGENIRRFMALAPKAMYYTGFGQTEAMAVTRAPVTERPGSAGRPSALTQVKLFDDHDNEVPVGQPGEICVRSPTVFLGYWGLEADTAETFRNGWHHTGDIGKLDADGYLFYVKRKAQKELIKPGGENVYPAEVEKVILEHDHIAEVCVIGVADPKWGEAIKAVCVLHPGTSLAEKDLIAFVGDRIARYKKPQYVVFVDPLPKIEDGSIDREQVKKAHGAKY